MIEKLFKFHGGVHPPEHKAESAATPIRPVPMPARLVLPLRQHIGNVAKVKVAVGDHVLKGQQLAAPEGMISAAVHAPTSGTVVAIDEQLIPHVSGLPDLCITLQADGEDRWIEREPLDYEDMEKTAVIEALRQAGVVGLGGATFPTHVKLRADPRHPVKTLILNGAECEPFITCDDRLMRERADEIIRGLQIMAYLLDAECCLVGIEDNKPEAAQAMRTACARSAVPVEVVLVPTLYPGGGAKQLIKVLTGWEVPSGKLPSEIGVQCFNVATAYAVHRFIDHGEPVISRIVTVTGKVARPGNFEVPLGMAIETLVQAAGGAAPDIDGFIMGGPMMGFKLPSPRVPVVKATNCIIAASPDLFPPQPLPMPCIRCARCADVCPANLQPQELYWFAKSQNFEKARDYHLFDCIECGCCSYVCPSHIPLVQYYRYAKSEIIALDRAKQAANLARERNQLRLARIEREKQERQARHAQKAMGAKTDTAADEAKKAIIAAAIERAKAQKAAVTPQNTDHLPPEAQAEIARIEARRSQAMEQQKE
ncbi:MAG: electron transport complex subunit RsxC [Methylophilaceae bacterium]|nr:electron transport complex subunit RsxC [Methylophilaceae bacterium]